MSNQITDKEFRMTIRTIERLIRMPDIPPLALVMLANMAGEQIAKKLSESGAIQKIVSKGEAAK